MHRTNKCKSAMNINRWRSGDKERLEAFIRCPNRLFLRSEPRGWLPGTYYHNWLTARLLFFLILFCYFPTLLF